MAAKKGLGRGLDILIPKDSKPKSKEAPETGTKKTGSGQTDQKEEMLVSVNEIEPNRDQPRKQFDENSINDLADSIKKYGLIQPIIVQKKEGYYEIIAGERRWRASKKAGLKKVPVIIKEFNETDTLKISLIENIQRENLNPIEEAQAYQLLKDKYHLKQEDIAESLSKSRAAIANTMRLLNLDERIQNLIMENQISSGHGRTLLGITDKDIQYKAALKIRDENLSVREAEKYVKSLLKKLEEEAGQEENKNPDDDINKKTMFHFFEERLEDIFSTKVSIKNKKNNNGRIEISYSSQDELQKIIDLMQSIK